MRFRLMTILLIGCQPQWVEVKEIEDGDASELPSEESSSDPDLNEQEGGNSEETETLQGAGEFEGEYSGYFSIEVDYGTGWPDGCDTEMVVAVSEDGSWSAAGDCSTWWSGSWTIGFEGELRRVESASVGELSGVVSYDNVSDDQYYEAELIGYSELIEGDEAVLNFEWQSDINGAAVSGVSELTLQ